jgi:hypothetical protein
MWPLPGEILFKEIYLILPDVYTPISPGYSNEQFIVSADGTKQVMLHLRHKENTDMGADTKVFIQAPVTTDEADHAMTAIESTTGGATYSLVTKGQEVIVEVTYLKAAGISAEHSTSAHEELLRAIEKMEIIW